MSHFTKYCKHVYKAIKDKINDLKFDYHLIKSRDNLNVLKAVIQVLNLEFNDLKHSIRNLIYWFPYIWNDKDWDYFFIYVLLRTKLNKVLRFMKLYSISECEEEKKQLKRCIELLDELIEDDVLREEFEKFYQKYGHAKFSFKKMDNGWYSLEAGYANVKTKEEYEEAEKLFKELMYEEENKKLELRTELFDTIKNNIERWWD